MAKRAKAAPVQQSAPRFDDEPLPNPREIPAPTWGHSYRNSRDSYGEGLVYACGDRE